MALRAAAAKGMAIGTIAATVAAASILIAWPERPTAPAGDADRPGAPIAPRAVPVNTVALPDARPEKFRAPSIEKRAPEEARAPVVARAIPDEITALPLPHALGSPHAELERLGVRAVEETPPLASRSIAFVSEPMQVARAPIGEVEPPRRGALTRAMGTTADAFRTAGTSVAGALKKVF